MEQKPRGFAALSPERRKEIASKGGKSVKPENRAYSRDPELARLSGIKPRAKKRTFYKDPDYAQECGRKGGLVKKKKEIVDVACNKFN